MAKHTIAQNERDNKTTRSNFYKCATLHRIKKDTTEARTPSLSNSKNNPTNFIRVSRRDPDYPRQRPHWSIRDTWSEEESHHNGFSVFSHYLDYLCQNPSQQGHVLIELAQEMERCTKSEHSKAGFFSSLERFIAQELRHDFDVQEG